MNAEADHVEDNGTPEQQTPEQKQDTLTQSVGQTLAPTVSKPWWKRLTGS